MELKRLYVRTDTIVEADEFGVRVKQQHVYKEVLVESFKKRLLSRVDFWVTLFILFLTIVYTCIFQYKILVFIMGCATSMHIFNLYNIISEEKNRYT